jgi:hypothetical protein
MKTTDPTKAHNRAMIHLAFMPTLSESAAEKKEKVSGWSQHELFARDYRSRATDSSIGGSSSVAGRPLD